MTERLDGWENVITGLGSLRDKLTHHAPQLRQPLRDSTLEALHSDDDIAARIVEKLPDDALRAGFCITLPADEDNSATLGADLTSALQALGADTALHQAWCWARLYGLGAVLLGVDDGLDTREPLDLGRVVRLSHLTVLRRTQLQPETYYNEPLAPRFGEVESYRLMRLAIPRGSAVTVRSYEKLDAIVHESRLLQFRGVLTSRWGAASEQFFDDSVLQRAYDAMQASSSAWMSVGHLLTDASQGVFRVKNLLQLLAANGEEKLRKRVQIMDLVRSVCRALLIDADAESFERVATSFTGMPDLLDRYMLRVSAAAEMPATVLWGRSPAGMNATGESDVRNWYDKVGSERTKVLTPRIEQLTRVLMAADDSPTKGNVLDEFEVEYPPLWQPSAKEAAETFNLRAQALVSLVNARIIRPEEAALNIAQAGELDEIDTDAREAMLELDIEAELERLRQGGTSEPRALPPDNPPPPDEPAPEPS
jgi:phage-related protein (TIGR01555 family)